MERARWPEVLGCMACLLMVKLVLRFMLLVHGKSKRTSYSKMR
jgi:hypothetical protein